MRGPNGDRCMELLRKSVCIYNKDYAQENRQEDQEKKRRETE